METAVKYLEYMSLPVWLIMLVVLFLHLFRNPLAMAIQWRVFGLKANELRLSVLSSVELSESVRYAVLDAVESDEFYRATRMRLNATRRTAASELVMNNSELLTWGDVRRALPFMDSKEGLIIKLSLVDYGLFYAARLATTFLFVLGVLHIMIWVFFMGTQGEFSFPIFFMAVAYLFFSIVARISWVHPYESARAIREIQRKEGGGQDSSIQDPVCESAI